MSGAGLIPHLVLVVEDDAETAQSLKQLLEQHGQEVLITKDGGQAQATFAMRQPDIVILDLILPGESGFEVCQRIRQTHETVPVLILSVIDIPDSKQLAERVGADGYLTKPFDPNTLLECVSRLLQQAWEQKQGRQPKEEDRIHFSCQCGKRFKVNPVHKGETLTCSSCGETLLIPRFQ